MVHLFEWKYTDIANECEQFLSKYNYGAVQISPPQEHIMLREERRRPVTSGVNGLYSSGGSSYFNGVDGQEQFPGVPYGSGDFNDPRCDHNIDDSDYQNSAYDVKTCRLAGLLDLDQGTDYVRGRIIDMLNRLIDMGVAGFRFDASKHMWPDDLKAILQGGVHNLRADIFGANKRPFVVHEVIDRGGEAIHVSDYTALGRYTNFNFGADVTQTMWRYNDIADLANLKEGYHYGNGKDEDVLNFLDNHGETTSESRQPYVVTYKDGIKYKMAVAFMLAWTYGYPRVMSSYDFNDRERGPPNLGSSQGYATRTPNINPNDETCYPDGWVCEHRWPEIRQMAQFRSIATGSPVAEIQQGHQMLAFARAGKGYLALSNNDYNYDLNNVNTTLPAGNYCDIASGQKEYGGCTGRMITVDANGFSTFTIYPNNFIAFHLGSKL
ncbi:Glycosyl hydrolase and Alpha-amylase domain containing protein [Aphelenchoides fujianensis]|nr:Glycosyl hydrolase and Alpha-amylase domain containing protein [Aphelenchoides fujianensis]